jgi:hypothetical protein
MTHCHQTWTSSLDVYPVYVYALQVGELTCTIVDMDPQNKLCQQLLLTTTTKRMIERTRQFKLHG